MNRTTVFFLVMFIVLSTSLFGYFKSSFVVSVPVGEINDPAANEVKIFDRHDSDIVYKSEQLLIRQLSPHVYLHVSYLDSKDFGRVECNGMIVINGKEAVVFDTPAGEKSSSELIEFIDRELHSRIKAIIPTHFHEDCVGGLEIFNQKNIPSFASAKTIQLLREKGRQFSKPIQSFRDSLSLTVGDKKVFIKFFGEGHTKDNVVGYFPNDDIMFGGCLIKEVGASKGNLADANVSAWSETVRKVKQSYPQVKIVIPGHGKTGGGELLDYTIKLFQ